jgi:hypothetical protein
VIFVNCQNHDDESAKIESFINQNPRHKQILINDYIRLYEAWNLAIKSSESEYICTYNADDQWRPDYLTKMVSYLDDHRNIAICSSGVLITDVPNQLYPSWNHIIGEIPKLTYPRTTAGPSPMWRRSLHDTYGYFGNYRVIGDARFWEALHAGGENFGLLEDDLVLYYASIDSLERRCDGQGNAWRKLDIEESHNTSKKAH